MKFACLQMSPDEVVCICGEWCPSVVQDTVDVPLPANSPAKYEQLYCLVIFVLFYIDCNNI